MLPYCHSVWCLTLTGEAYENCSENLLPVNHYCYRTKCRISWRKEMSYKDMRFLWTACFNQEFHSHSIKRSIMMKLRPNREQLLNQTNKVLCKSSTHAKSDLLLISSWFHFEHLKLSSSLFLSTLFTFICFMSFSKGKNKLLHS